MRHWLLRLMLLLLWIETAEVNAQTHKLVEDVDDRHSEYLHVTIGVGYEYLTHAYGKDGLSLDLTARYYFGDRFFGAAKTQYGLHSGSKTIQPKKDKSKLYDDVTTWTFMGGTGYDLWQNSTCDFVVYAQGLVGYGGYADKYEVYTNGVHTRRKTYKGIAADLSIGSEYTSRSNFLFGINGDAIYVGRRMNFAVSISMGYLF